MATKYASFDLKNLGLPQAGVGFGGQDLLNPGNPMQSFKPVELTNTQQSIAPVDAYNSPILPGGGNVAETPGMFEGMGDWAFGKDGKPGQAGSLLEGAGSLFNAYNAYQANQLGRDKYNRSVQESDVSLENMAKNYGLNLENSYKKTLNARGTYDTSTPEGRAQFQQELDSYVNRNAIRGTV